MARWIRSGTTDPGARQSFAWLFAGSRQRAQSSAGHSKRYGLYGAMPETANAQALPPLTPQQPSARGPATRPGSAGTPPVAAPHPRRIVARKLVHSPRPVPRQLNLQLRHHRNRPRPHQRRRRCRAAHLKTVSHPVPGSPEEAPGSSASSSPTAPSGSPSRSRPASASKERAQRTRFGAAGGASSPLMPRLRGLCAFLKARTTDSLRRGRRGEFPADVPPSRPVRAWALRSRTTPPVDANGRRRFLICC